MATGNYGIVRPATVTTSDMEIYYTYSLSRDTEPIIPLQALDPAQVIKTFDDPVTNGGTTPIFNGLYNLELPLDTFSSKGIYTVVIRPKEIRTTITDCGVLAAFQDIKGIILDMNTLGIQNASQLIGYRVEYFDVTTGQRIPNFFRVITSANRAEPVNSNLSNTVQKSVKYRFNDTSNLVFCTLTPSSAPSVRPNQFPDIGIPAQAITITNTFFNPILLEIDMVKYDIETLAYGLFGNQSKSIVDGLYTIYDFENRIFEQYNLYEVQNRFSSQPLFEVRERINNIDFSKEFNTITQISPGQ